MVLEPRHTLTSVIIDRNQILEFCVEEDVVVGGVHAEYLGEGSIAACHYGQWSHQSGRTVPMSQECIVLPVQQRAKHTL